LLVPNKQRRDAERLRLQRQLEQRREQEVARQRTTLIASIISGVLLVAIAIVVIVVATHSTDDKKTPVAAGKSPTAAASSPAATTPAPATTSAAPVPQAKGAAVTYKGVTVQGAKDVSGAPKVTSKSATVPTALESKDLVVGKGAVAKANATVSIQYTGVLYKDGTEFDSSWDKGGTPASFALKTGNGGVIPGFAQGIGGTSTIPPMHVGGRRILILPSALAYGPQANGPIPANSTLVFVVDLLKVS
jgi:FKBP-type peptidyl-prolyl cis-trans isomerase